MKIVKYYLAVVVLVLHHTPVQAQSQQHKTFFKVVAVSSTEREIQEFDCNHDDGVVASGMYLYRLTARSLVSGQTFTAGGKMVLLR